MLSFSKIEDNRKINTLTFQGKKDRIVKEEFLMLLEIEKLNLKKGIYDFNSPLNDVSKNVQLINGSTFPDTLYSNVILASHSGNSKISYFKNLERLEMGDSAILYYKNYKYKYKLVRIYQELKDGSIVIRREKKQNHLILITCDKRNTNLQNVYVFLRYSNLLD